MPQPILGVDIEPEDVDWLWEDRIPRKMFSIIAGKPDQGKSTVAIKIAADVTAAGGSVLWSGGERNPALVDHPRFLANGGVASRIHYWRFHLPRMFDELAAHILDKGIDLIVLDPVSAHFLGVSTGSDQIREVLNPLVELIEVTGTAVLFIEHALKRVSPHADPLSAIRGNSSGIPAACAMGFLFGTDPGNDDAKILACVKSNIRLKPMAMAFETDECEVDGYEQTFPALVFDQEVTIDPIRLISKEPGHGKVGRPSDKRAAAAEWLTNYLAAAVGAPVLGSKVQEDAKQAGMTGRTLRRAAQDMGIVKNPPGGGPNCTWELPEDILDLLNETDEDEVVAVPEVVVELEEPSDLVMREGDGGHPEWVDMTPTVIEVVSAEVEADELTISDDDLAKLLGGLAD